VAKVCLFPECGKEHAAKGYCHAHYMQLRSGKPLRKLKSQYSIPPDEQARIIQMSGLPCLVGQTLTSGRRGYPEAKLVAPDGIKRFVKVHRLVMEHVLGRPLSPKEVVHHKDGNVRNTHPSNLQLFASQTEHLRVAHPELRGICATRSQQQTCKFGHQLLPRKGSNPRYRRCYVCLIESRRAWRARRKALGLPRI
jgi:hypothetical protein